MKNTKYDLAVAYRIYPEISRFPPIYSDNKFNLAKICLESFKSSLGDLKVKIWAILDKCPSKYETLFKDRFEDEDLEIVKVNGIGNKATFNLQIKILLKQNYSQLVYFAEDDYFYIPNKFGLMISSLKREPNFDFISPYDHLDQYTLALHQYKSLIKISEGQHWRMIASTCCTFLTNKRTLKKTKKIFKKYLYVKKKRSSYKILLKIPLLRSLFRYSDLFSYTIDSDIWLSLTKINIFKFFRIIKFRIHELFLFSVYFKVWRFNWKQVLFGKRWKLWCPIPSIATHMDSRSLAPNIDWENHFRKLIDK